MILSEGGCRGGAGEHNRNLQHNARRQGSRNPRSFDREDLRHAASLEMLGEGLANLHQELGVQLMVQEGIHVENVSGKDIPKLENSLAQHLHASD